MGTTLSKGSGDTKHLPARFGPNRPLADTAQLSHWRLSPIRFNDSAELLSGIGSAANSTIGSYWQLLAVLSHPTRALCRSSQGPALVRWTHFLDRFVLIDALNVQLARSAA
jgi:hypothetical protein